MMKIAIVFATRFEIPSSLRHLKLNNWIHQDQLQIRLVVTGIGQTKASESIKELCHNEKPDMILSVGICGGISPKTKVGDLLLVSRVHHRGVSVVLVNGLQAAQKCLQASELGYTIGELETFDCPVTSMSVLNAPMAMGVDMESFAIAEIAQYFNVPLIILRVVSDIVPYQKPVLWAEMMVIVRIFVNVWVRRVTEPLGLFIATFLKQKATLPE